MEYWCRRASPVVLAEAMVRCFCEPCQTEAMGRAARRTVQTTFTFEEQNRRLETIYAEILAPDRASERQQSCPSITQAARPPDMDRLPGSTKLLKTSLKQAYCWLAEVSGLSRISQRPCVTVLAYHRIVSADPERELCVSPELFDRQVALLASAFRIISLEEAVTRLEKGDLESHYVVLTFDDGWLDNYVHAFPVLKKYAVPATIFVTTDAISSGRFSWYEFDDAILQTSALSIDLEPYGLGCLSLRNPRLRSSAVDRLHGILKNMEHSRRQEVAESVIRRYGRPAGSRIMLNWNELREMMASGLVTVGGHTISHPDTHAHLGSGSTQRNLRVQNHRRGKPRTPGSFFCLSERNARRHQSAVDRHGPRCRLCCSVQHDCRAELFACRALQPEANSDQQRNVPRCDRGSFSQHARDPGAGRPRGLALQRVRHDAPDAGADFHSAVANRPTPIAPQECDTRRIGRPLSHDRQEAKTMKHRVPLQAHPEPAPVPTSGKQGMFPHITVIVIILYNAYLICTPYFRFEIFATLKTERILAALSLVALALTGRLKPTFTKIAGLLIALFLWMAFSYYLSPYHNASLVTAWFNEYWKTILLYFLVFFSLTTLKDIGWFFTGWAATSFCYQVLSMSDFVRGGSYVYQQGIRRVIGAWSEGGLGAANGHALMALITMIIAVFLAKRPIKARYRFFLYLLILLSLVSIVFSGTRGALLVAVVLAVFLLRKHIFKLKIILPLAIAGYMAFLWMPPEYKHRYFGMIFQDKTREQTGYDELAEQSAQSRLQGLIDGWRLALRRPLVGYGPGASAIARHDYYPIKFAEGPLQLHNLLGQVMADIGFIGTAIFLTIIACAAFQPGKGGVAAPPVDSSGYYPEYCSLVRYLLLGLFLYGFFAHTLYRYQWVVFWAISDALLRIRKRHDAQVLSTGAADQESA